MTEAPAFFIPDVADPEDAEQVYRAIKAFAHETTGWAIGDRRIFRIRYEHNGKSLVAEVGKPDPLTGELVFAILASNSYLVCTPNRGVRRGMPILAGVPGRRSVEEFAERSDDA